MKRSTWIGGGFALALAAALLAWAFAPRPVAVELAQARFGPFETTIDEDGRTRLAERWVVSAPLAARLTRIALREGDEVKAGDVLARLQPVLSPLLDERTRREQATRVDGAQAGVALAVKRVEGARVALERARDELRRSEQLAQQGFVAATKLSGDRLAVQAAQKELEAATEAQHVASHELELARVALGVAQGAARGGGAPFELRAPVAGRVLKVHLSSEATVAPGAPLVDLGDLSRLEVVSEMLTADALQARPGSEVRIERWGGPQALQGRVRRVEPAAFTKVSALGVEEQRVNVVIDLTSPREQWAALGEAFRVGVRVVTRSEARVLKVPVGAVFPPAAAATAAASTPDSGAAMAVFLADGGRARLQAVRVMARNGSEAWIGQGLAEGATVVVYPAAGLVDGARITSATR
ncbi:MAG: HlyD family efflux transporter periplasmic adaptor subunit [Rubrivivax sp.]